jgi:hypothetical protein
MIFIFLIVKQILKFIFDEYSLLNQIINLEYIRQIEIVNHNLRK